MVISKYGVDNTIGVASAKRCILIDPPYNLNKSKEKILAFGAFSIAGSRQLYLTKLMKYL